MLPSMLTSTLTVGSRKHGRGPVVFSWDPRAKFLASTGTSKVVHIHKKHGEGGSGLTIGAHDSSGADGYVLHHQITPPGSSVCRALEWDRHGQRLAIVQENSATLVLWHTAAARRGSGGRGFGSGFGSSLSGDSGGMGFKGGFGGVGSNCASISGSTRVVAATGEQILNICGREHLSFIKWSRKGQQLAVGTTRGSMIIYDPVTGVSTRVTQASGGQNRNQIGAGGGGFGGTVGGGVGEVSNSSSGSGTSGMGSGTVLDGDWSIFSNRLAWVTEDRHLHICSDQGSLLDVPRRLKSKAESLIFGASPHEPENDSILAINMSGQSLLIYNTNVPSRAVELQFEDTYGPIVSHQWDSSGRVLVAFSRGFLAVVSTLADSVYREQFCIRLHENNLPLKGFAFCDYQHRAATCDEESVRLVDSDMFCENLYEIIVPDLTQGMLDRISWTADGSVLTISDKNGSLFSYAMRCVENPNQPSASLMSIATGPVAAALQLMSEPISFQRIVFTLLVAGVIVLCMTAHGMETHPETFMRAVLGLSEVI